MVKLRKRGDTLPLFLYKPEGLHTHTVLSQVVGLYEGRGKTGIGIEQDYNGVSGMMQSWKV